MAMDGMRQLVHAGPGSQRARLSGVDHAVQRLREALCKLLQAMCPEVLHRRKMAFDMCYAIFRLNMGGRGSTQNQCSILVSACRLLQQQTVHLQCLVVLCSSRDIYIYIYLLYSCDIYTLSELMQVMCPIN